MKSFLGEFFSPSDERYTVVVMDEKGMERPRQHQVRPRRLMWGWSASLFGVALLTAGMIVFTPLREVILGTGTARMKRDARLNALRLTALRDSLSMQRRYVRQLRNLMTGAPTDTAAAPAPSGSAEAYAAEPESGPTPKPYSQDWRAHQQPALSIEQTAIGSSSPAPPGSTSAPASLSALQFPVLPPVEGLLTRGYDARTGHYAVDLAVDEGTVVRSIGDGHVILADWTHDGGYAIAVQHAGGYVSVYKHNKRLLKRTGDRVRARASIALSGNTGEVTTGPHLHFELWRNGLAQDPASYFIGL
jgi:murein DD-endopeptidase MepM/ murein hydrolase activator NlpD